MWTNKAACLPLLAAVVAVVWRCFCNKFFHILSRHRPIRHAKGHFRSHLPFSVTENAPTSSAGVFRFITAVFRNIVTVIEPELTGVLLGFILGLVVAASVLKFGMDIRSEINLEDVEIEFEFPGLNGSENVRTYKINAMNASGAEGLQMLAKSLKIPYSGKKREQLRKELREFSLNKGRWNLNQRRAQHAHKGPCNNKTQDGGVTKQPKPKKQSQRRLELLEQSQDTAERNIDGYAVTIKSNVTKTWACQLLSECMRGFAGQNPGIGRLEGELRWNTVWSG